MANQYINKVILGEETLIDISDTQAVASDVMNGKKFYLKSGQPATGTCNYDANTSDATASAGEILATKTAYVSGAKVTGSMSNRGSVTGTISSRDQQFTIQEGYHDGSGKVAISETERAKLIPSNIRQGITILSVEGEMSGTEDMDIEPAKSVTPTLEAQTVLPATGYDGMAQVNVAAIPVTRTDNAQGGVQVVIAGA